MAISQHVGMKQTDKTLEEALKKEIDFPKMDFTTLSKMYRWLLSPEKKTENKKKAR